MFNSCQSINKNLLSCSTKNSSLVILSISFVVDPYIAWLFLCKMWQRVFPLWSTLKKSTDSPSKPLQFQSSFTNQTQQPGNNRFILTFPCMKLQIRSWLIKWNQKEYTTSLIDLSRWEIYPRILLDQSLLWQTAPRNFNKKKIFILELHHNKLTNQICTKNEKVENGSNCLITNRVWVKVVDASQWLWRPNNFHNIELQCTVTRFI